MNSSTSPVHPHPQFRFVLFAALSLTVAIIVIIRTLSFFHNQYALLWQAIVLGAIATICKIANNVVTFRNQRLNARSQNTAQSIRRGYIVDLICGVCFVLIAGRGIICWRPTQHDEAMMCAIFAATAATLGFFGFSHLLFWSGKITKCFVWGNWVALWAAIGANLSLLIRLVNSKEVRYDVLHQPWLGAGHYFVIFDHNGTEMMRVGLLWMALWIGANILLYKLVTKALLWLLALPDMGTEGGQDEWALQATESRIRVANFFGAIIWIALILESFVPPLFDKPLVTWVYLGSTMTLGFPVFLRALKRFKLDYDLRQLFGCWLVWLFFVVIMFTFTPWIVSWFWRLV